MSRIRSEFNEGAYLVFEHARPDFSLPSFSWQLERFHPKALSYDSGKQRPIYTIMALKHVSLDALEALGWDYELEQGQSDNVIIRSGMTAPEQKRLWTLTKAIRMDQNQQEERSKTANQAASILPHKGLRRRKQKRRPSDNRAKQLEIPHNGGALKPGAQESARSGDDWETISASSSHSTHSFRQKHTLQPYNDPNLGKITWFWLSQTDTIPGYWSTPWRSFEDLNEQSCSAAIAVLIMCIVDTVGEDGNHYFPRDKYKSVVPDTVAAMRKRFCTYPPYAWRCDRGRVCPGTYAAFRHAAFTAEIPRVEFFGTFQEQTSSSERFGNSLRATELRLVELMRLDAWLSIVGRMAEISQDAEKPNGFLRRVPCLVADLLNLHQARIFDADQYEFSDKYEAYERLKRSFLFEARVHGEAKMLYLLVATLRTAKVGRAVLAGPDTRMLMEILEKDVQVYLV